MGVFRDQRSGLNEVNKSRVIEVYNARTQRAAGKAFKQRVQRPKEIYSSRAEEALTWSRRCKPSRFMQPRQFGHEDWESGWRETSC